jgi:hypothetical protein
VCEKEEIRKKAHGSREEDFIMGTCGSRPSPVVRLQLDKKDAAAARNHKRRPNNTTKFSINVCV